MLSNVYLIFNNINIIDKIKEINFLIYLYSDQFIGIKIRILVRYEGWGSENHSFEWV